MNTPWLGTEAAAAYLGYESVRYFREKIAVQPGFPVPKLFAGKSIRWHRDQLDAWAEAQPEKGTA